MENKLSIIAIILIVLFIGIYTSREYTEGQYKTQLNQINNIRDSLNRKIIKLNTELSQRDTLLISNIKQSRKIISEIQNNINISDIKYKEYEKQSQNIIDELNELCKSK